MRTDAVIGSILVALVIGLCVWAYGAGTQLSGIDVRPAGLVEQASAAPDGAALFVGNCAGCHGAQAQGGVGPKLAGLLRPWSTAQFAHAVLDGQAPGGRTLAPMMPHFRVSGFDGVPPTDSQLAAVLRFVQGQFVQAQ